MIHTKHTVKGGGKNLEISENLKQVFKQGECSRRDAQVIHTEHTVKGGGKNLENSEKQKQVFTQDEMPKWSTLNILKEENWKTKASFHTRWDAQMIPTEQTKTGGKNLENSEKQKQVFAQEDVQMIHTEHAKGGKQWKTKKFSPHEKMPRWPTLN